MDKTIEEAGVGNLTKKTLKIHDISGCLSGPGTVWYIFVSKMFCAIFLAIKLMIREILADIGPPQIRLWPYQWPLEGKYVEMSHQEKCTT